MRIRNTFILSLLAMMLVSCTPYDFSKRIVKQGTLISQKKLQRLKPGLSKEDVAILMGTSLVNPMFNLDRWDYAYTVRIGGGKTRTESLVIYFSHDRLTRIVHKP